LLPERLSLLLKGAYIHDGTGRPPYRADVGLTGEKISFVGDGTPLAENVMELGGLCLSPGFIDVHGHSDFALLAHPSAEGKVLQGITTEINGNCGLSAAPLYADALRQREGDLAEHGIAERWSGFQEFLGLLEARGVALNFATLVGHGNLRASVVGYADRGAKGAEMQGMKRLLREALEAGAIGLSTGLIYPPGAYSGTEELIELAGCGLEAARAGGGFIYASHMRSEGELLIEAIEEVIRIGRETGTKVHISHIKTAGRENWHKIDRAIEVIEAARAEGIAVSCDRYPYTAGATDLDAVLPPWVHEGGLEEEMKRLRDPGVRERISNELRDGRHEWGSIYIATVQSPKNGWMQGRGLEDIASRVGVDPVDALLDVLVEERLRVGAVFHSMSEENLRRFLSLPYAMVGTDSTARPMDSPGKPHPRGFGSFPRYLGRYAGPSAGDLARAVQKITSLPARTFGLRGRGEIKEGGYADLVVFDPERIRDRATYDDPLRVSEGILHVFVNGEPVVSGGVPTGRRPGRVLRHGGS
jgi:N-acyl-D-amino-acid deacylase